MNKNKLLNNALYNVIYRGFTALFPLVTMGYISRILLADGVGKISYVNTIVAYFTTVASLGIPNYGVKVIAQADGVEKRTEAFIELFVINFVSTSLCTIAYYLIVNECSYFIEKRVLFNVMGLILILNVFNIDWLYQGVEEYGFVATRSIIIKVISFLLMILTVKEPGDYVKYAFVLCMATAGNYILNVLHARHYIDVKHSSKPVFSKHLKPVLILLASSLATEIYTMLDTVMLEYYHGDSYVGYYANDVKIVRMLYTVVIAFVAAFYPRISYYIKSENTVEFHKLIYKGTEIIVLIATPCMIGLFLMADNVVLLLFGNDFNPAVFTLKILSVLVFIFSITYFLGHVVLMAASKEKVILFATICGAIVNATSNIILIPKYYQSGAAMASVLAEVVVSVIMLYNSQKVTELRVSKKMIMDVLIANIAMTCFVGIMKYMISKLIVSVVLCIATGAVVYFATLFMLKNPLVIGLVRKLKRHDL